MDNERSLEDGSRHMSFEPPAPNPLDIIRNAYKNYEQRDLSGVFALLSPAIEIMQTTELPWGGRYQGHDGARKFFAALNEHTAATPQPRTFVPAGDQVAVTGRLVGFARVTSMPIDLDIVHVWTVRSGLIVRFEAYVDTPGMLQALRGKPG
jgi:ketosteroid isomerase-like protein